MKILIFSTFLGLLSLNQAEAGQTDKSVALAFAPLGCAVVGGAASLRGAKLSTTAAACAAGAVAAPILVDSAAAMADEAPNVSDLQQSESEQDDE